MVSFAVTLLPIVLYTGAINLESIFNVSEVLNISQSEGIWITVITIGVIGSIYAIFGGLKAVALSDSVNAIGLLIGGLMVPIFALWDIGDGNILDGVKKVYDYAPEKFNVIGKEESVLPFSTIFTGLMINQLYFWGMNQTIIQRAFGAKNMAEAQKGLLYTGVIKVFIPLIIVLPGIIAYYYYSDQYYDNQDFIYPVLLTKVMPLGLLGFFAAVVLGAILSTFNSVLNSAATIFSLDIYKKLLDKQSNDKKLVRVGRLSSLVLAVFAILIAPLVGNAPEGLYQLMQQLNGIFFIPIASILIAGFFIPRVTANGAKVGLVTGLSFYLLTTFIFDSGIHFIHIWAIEFVINLMVMLIVSHYFPGKPNTFVKRPPVLEMEPWKYAKPVSLGLCVVTILIYIWLGS
jgi:SSS family solute:Na+ symporter